MYGLTKLRGLTLLAVLVFAAAEARAAQVVSNTARGVSAVMRHGDFYLNPAGSPGQFRGDLAPVQTFELVRPMNQRVTIGRLFTSCTCVRLESPKQTYEPGEPAIFHLRNVRPTPQNGQTYAMYVQITSPIRTTLRYDTFVQSSQFKPVVGEGAPEVEEIVADGEFVIADGELDEDVAAVDDSELIVPKADNYVEDTSEYTLRKKAEAKQDAAESGVRGGGSDEDGDADSEEKAVAAADDADADKPVAAAEDAEGDKPSETGGQDAGTAAAKTDADGDEADSAAAAAREGGETAEKRVDVQDDIWEAVDKPKKKLRKLSDNTENKTAEDAPGAEG